MSPVLASLLIALAICAVLSALLVKERRAAAEALRDATRRGEDLLAEKQTERDLAVTATLTMLLNKLGERVQSPPSETPLEYEVAFDVLQKFVESETTGVKAMVDSFREKCAVLDAATKAAQGAVAQAAQEVTNIRAENTLHRTLLTKALSLPLDTPQGHRDLFLMRCEAVLESPRATFDCPSDEFWTSYVAKHRKAHEKGLSA